MAFAMKAIKSFRAVGEVRRMGEVFEVTEESRFLLLQSLGLAQEEGAQQFIEQPKPLPPYSLRVIPKPAGLNWAPPFYFYQDLTTGAFRASVDIGKLQKTGKTYYVSNSGSNTANDGLTPEKAFRTVAKALSMADADMILVQPGTYLRNYCQITGLNKEVTIKANGGPVIFSMHDALTWTVETGAAYKAARSGVGDVYDAAVLDENGDYTHYKKVASAAAVATTAGSWYADGTNVFVRTLDGRAPDDNIRVFLNVKNAEVVGAAKVHFEGITFEGGQSVLQITAESATKYPTVYGKNCKFKYGTLNNAVTSQGADTYFQNCEAAQGFRDGFNYHEYFRKCRSFEIDCIGRHNGMDPADNTCNGSTSHDGSTVVRVNGQYYGNHGPNVVDVNGCHSWNIGVMAFESTASVDTSNVNFYIDGTMWADSIFSVGSKYDLRLGTPESLMYVRNARTLGKNMTAEGALLANY